MSEYSQAAALWWEALHPAVLIGFVGGLCTYLLLWCAHLAIEARGAWKIIHTATAERRRQRSEWIRLAVIGRRGP